MNRREYKKSIRAKWVKEHRCYSCSKPLPENWESVTCEQCRSQQYLARKKRVDLLHLEALQIVGKGNLICQRCGCSNVEALEINHTEGNGNSDRKEFGLVGEKLYKQIISGKRKTDDLNILCKVCNFADYFEIKMGCKWQIKCTI